MSSGEVLKQLLEPVVDSLGCELYVRDPLWVFLLMIFINHKKKEGL